MIKNKKSKDYCKADPKNVYCFFITIFRLVIPAEMTYNTKKLEKKKY